MCSIPGLFLTTWRLHCCISLLRMVAWVGLSMTTTLLLITWCPILIPLCYWFMDKKHARLQSAGAQYLPLDLASQEQAPSLTFKRKMQLIWYNMPLALAMYAGNCARFLLIQAVLTTLTFPGLSIKARDQYIYYALSVALGDLVGKAYGVVALLLNCKLPRYTKHTWVFSLLIVSAAVFLVCDAWFRFLHNGWAVIAICFGVGVLSGMLFDVTFAVAHGEPSSPSNEFSKSILSFPFAAGLLSSTCLGLYIEPLLEERCVYVTQMLSVCITWTIHEWGLGASVAYHGSGSSFILETLKPGLRANFPVRSGDTFMQSQNSTQNENEIPYDYSQNSDLGIRCESAPLPPILWNYLRLWRNRVCKALHIAYNRCLHLHSQCVRSSIFFPPPRVFSTGKCVV